MQVDCWDDLWNDLRQAEERHDERVNDCEVKRRRNRNQARRGAGTAPFRERKNKQEEKEQFGMQTRMTGTETVSRTTCTEELPNEIRKRGREIDD